MPEEGKGNTLFFNQFLAYKSLPKNIKEKIENLKGIFSSKGKIAKTRLLRESEHGTSDIKEIKSEHNLVQNMTVKAIYCSFGHVVGIKNLKSVKKINYFLSSHQTKKSFSYSFGWKKVTSSMV